MVGNVVRIDLAPDSCGWDVEPYDRYWRGLYYGAGVGPLAAIELSEGYDVFMQQRPSRNGIRNARKPSDCTTGIFDYESWIPDIHAIHHSMPVRSGGPMQGHYLRDIDEMGGWPSELRQARPPKCKNHWRVSWGIFDPNPGLVWDTRLVGYINVALRHECGRPAATRYRG
jgi:hypothetical protein